VMLIVRTRAVILTADKSIFSERLNFGIGQAKVNLTV